MSKHPERVRRLVALVCLALPAALAALAALAAPSGAGAETSIAFSTLLPNGPGPAYEVGAVATDPSGAVYVTGGYQPIDSDTAPRDRFPFVMKLSPSGEVLYNTIFPGTGFSMSLTIAVDGQGQACIAGFTEGGVPQVGGLDPAYRGTGLDAFVAKLGPGGEILYSTALGGSPLGFSSDIALGVGFGSQGAIYVAGYTGSPDFPRVGSPPIGAGGGGGLDVFVAKLMPGSPAPVWSTPFGGASSDLLDDLDVDSADNLYLTGHTTSGDFPTVNAFQDERAGGEDAFVTKLTSAGQVVYSSYFGGSGRDQGMTIAADAAGNAWLGGFTQSEDFPLKNPLQTTMSSSEGFVAGVGPAGALLFSTLFGGSASDQVSGIGVDASGLLHISGDTQSALFPLKDPIRDSCLPRDIPVAIRCVQDAFVARIDPRVPALLFSTYLGGSDPTWPDEITQDLAVDPEGNATVVGWTVAEDFPLVNPIFTSIEYPGFASFVTRFQVTDNGSPDCSGATASPSLLWPPNGKMVPVSILGVTDPEGDSIALRITGITQDEPGANFSGIGSSIAWVKAERAGKGDGRVYRILFEATDPSGASCAGEVKVCVPHDRGKGKGSCVDSTR